MLNPNLSNFRIEISDEFFPTEICDKYNNYLTHKNAPIKNINTYVHEGIKEVQIPGLNASVLSIPGMGNNLSNNNEIDGFSFTKNFVGSASQNEIISGNNIIITSRNTLLNLIYFIEIFHKYYKRQREVETFNVQITLLDSAEIPIIRFDFMDCFLSAIPDLSLTSSDSMSESKTIDIGFTFNRLDTEFILPIFNTKNINL